MDANQIEALAAREVLYRVPGMDAVGVERDRVYAASGGESLTFDLYRPAGAAPAGLRPVVVLVGGFPGAGVRRIFGRPFKAMGASVSWCRLLAASGIAAVAYENRAPVEDLAALLAFLRSEGAALGLDGARLGLFATSGNAPLALGTAIAQPIACLALAYPYTLDLDGGTAVAEAARAWGFANAGAGRSADDLPPEMPLLLVRAGRDQFAGLNDALDRLALAALRRNLALTCVNVPSALHAFDLEADTVENRRAIRRILAFCAESLGAGPAE